MVLGVLWNSTPSRVIFLCARVCVCVCSEPRSGTSSNPLPTPIHQYTTSESPAAQSSSFKYTMRNHVDTNCGVVFGVICVIKICIYNFYANKSTFYPFIYYCRKFYVDVLTNLHTHTLTRLTAKYTHSRPLNTYARTHSHIIWGATKMI